MAKDIPPRRKVVGAVKGGIVQIKNKFNLPGPVVEAVSQVRKPKGDSISVTALIDSPRIRSLTTKHWDSLEEDASSRLWALLGQGLHGVLAEYAVNKEVFAEEGIKATVSGTVISGRPDFYCDGNVIDYKITSVYSFLLGIKESWTRQCNVYGHLFRSAGFPVRSLSVHAILRDWVESKTYQDPDYPEIPFLTAPIDLWSPGDCEQYIKDQVRRHLDFPMDPCTDAEKWARSPAFAVSKVGGKRALRVLDTLREANQWGEKYHAEKPGVKLEIRERAGEFVRCNRYCLVRGVCDLNVYNNPTAEKGWEEL